MPSNAVAGIRDYELPPISWRGRLAWGGFRHCHSEGRDYDSIEKTILFLGDPFADLSDSLQLLSEYARMGIDMAVSVPRGDRPLQFVERTVRDLVPALSEM